MVKTTENSICTHQNLLNGRSFLEKNMGKTGKQMEKNKSVQRGSLGKTCFSLASWNATVQSWKSRLFLATALGIWWPDFWPFRSQKEVQMIFWSCFLQSITYQRAALEQFQGFFWSGMTTRKHLRSTIFSHQKELCNPFLLFKDLPGPGRPIDFRPQPPSKMIGLGGSFTANRRDFSAWDGEHIDPDG